MSAADDYPWGAPEQALLDIVRRQAESWAAGDAEHVARIAPSRVNDARLAEQLARLGRGAISPGAVAHYYRQSVLTDVRELLPLIQAPTLVLQRARDQIVRGRAGSVSGCPHPPRQVRRDRGDRPHLVHGERRPGRGRDRGVPHRSRASADPDRRLATVLFTDIVGSTARAAELGDTGWRALLDAHDAILREQLARFGGREIDSAGDGFLATFDGPGRAIRCASAIHDALAPVGLAVRAGVHTGEVEVRGEQIGGLAVHIGARVAATGGGGDIVVSSTVKDLLAGSGLAFVDRGEQELKGVPGTWRLFAAEN